MQVQRSLAAVDFLAVFVRADILAINLFGCSSVVLFAIIFIIQSILFVRFLLFEQQTCLFLQHLLVLLSMAHFGGINCLLFG